MQTQQSRCTYEPTENVTVHTKPAEAQARQSPITEWGKQRDVPPIAKKLFTRDTCLDKGKPASSNGVPLGIKHTPGQAVCS